MSTKLCAAIALAAFVVTPGLAQANTLVIGNGLASDCSQEALKGRFDAQVLELCNLAIETQALRREDAAKTFVNRGVIHLRRNSLANAEKDFASAERLRPDMPEVFVNRGAIRIRQRRFEEAVADITKGLAMEPWEPEKAYYNRALAQEAMGELQAAYNDFRKASQLKPDWEEPKKELARFIVEKR